VSRITLRRTDRGSLSGVRLLVACVLAAAVVAGCGSSGTTTNSASSGGGTGSATAKPLPKVSFSVASYNVPYLQLFVAEALDLYHKAGVNVDLQQNGTDFMTPVLAGRTDLAASGPTATFGPAMEGKNPKIIYDLSVGNGGFGLIVKANSRFKSLTDLSGATYGVYAPGTSSYGLATVLSRYIVAHGGKPLNLKTVSTPSGDIGSLIPSGIIDVTGESPYGAEPLITAGKARWLIPPQSDFWNQIYPKAGVAFTVWAPQRNIANNAQAVQRFTVALTMATQWIQAHSDQEVANALSKLNGFNSTAIPLQELVDVVKGARASISPDGTITPATWQTMMSRVWNSWALTFNLKDPQFAFGQRVDMSYIQAGKKG
jgi:ABC-type nitrate/sulfonate/bicarbonate transport system substrate-binding protein